MKWRLAKFGKWLIWLWIKEQRSIDGDYVQCREILDEWFPFSMTTDRD